MINHKMTMITTRVRFDIGFSVPYTMAVSSPGHPP
jgi:hypothetical protein